MAGAARRGKAWQGKARQGRRGGAWQGKARQGVARHGVAGEAWQARLGKAGLADLWEKVRPKDHDQVREELAGIVGW